MKYQKKKKKTKSPVQVHSPNDNPKALARLIDILSLQAESYDYQSQALIVEHILDMYCEIKAIPDPDFSFDVDSTGNFYITKGDADVYPTIVAHLDQVHDHKESYQILRDGDVLFGLTKQGHFYEQAGAGGDDLCGVWLCLEMLLSFDVVKVAFFIDEEVGCLGSAKANLDFFADSCFILQGDRRHDTVDYINHTNSVDVTSKEYEAALKPIMQEFGYEFNTGSITDVGELVCNDVGCVAGNISCGYLYAHTEDEVVLISGALTCLEFVTRIFTDLSYKRWEHKATPSYYPKVYDDAWWRQERVGLPVSGAEKICPECGEDHWFDSVEGHEYCHSCLYSNYTPQLGDIETQALKTLNV